MTLVIFGVGVFIFFISVYGTVVAGGLRLTARQLEEQPDLATPARLVGKQADVNLSVGDVTPREF